MILFLDFDGVLHPRPMAGRPGETNPFASLHLLEEVLRQVPHVEVVISSSWREFHPLDEMREFFAEDLRARIIDITPLSIHGEPVPAHLREFQRHAQCLAWLRRRRPPSTGWLAVDDDSTQFQPDCASLLLVDGAAGLTPENARDLLQRLQAGARIGRVRAGDR